MATARPAKPRGAKKPVAPPRARVALREELPRVAEEEAELIAPIEPAPEPPELRFPFEQDRRHGDPVAVFNSPESWNEGIGFARDERRRPLRFERGVLAVFSEEDAEVVRHANPRGKVYVEAEPRFASGPLICNSCYPRTRWYSTGAYERHVRRFHGNG